MTKNKKEFTEIEQLHLDKFAKETEQILVRAMNEAVLYGFSLIHVDENLNMRNISLEDADRLTKDVLRAKANSN